MTGITNALIRWVIVVAMGIATFIPTFGVLALSIQYFLIWPFVVIIADLIWTILLTLVLPFALPTFRWLTTAAITAITSVGIYLLWANLPTLFFGWPIYMWGVVVVSVAIGWLFIATPLWRWAKGTFPVTQTGHDLHPHH